MATQKVIQNTTITASLKKQAVILNEEMLKASSELIDGAVATSEKWQTLTEKAVKLGLENVCKTTRFGIDNLGNCKRSIRCKC